MSGLHRGGIKDEAQLAIAALDIIEQEPFLQFSGFMGYDPHVSKNPRLLGAARRAAFSSVQTVLSELRYHRRKADYSGPYRD